MTVLFKGIKKERISRLGYPLFAYAEGDADVTVQNCDNVWGYLFDKLELVYQLSKLEFTEPFHQTP